jgi:hypothetical protein
VCVCLCDEEFVMHVAMELTDEGEGRGGEGMGWDGMVVVACHNDSNQLTSNCRQAQIFSLPS